MKSGANPPLLQNCPWIVFKGECFALSQVLYTSARSIHTYPAHPASQREPPPPNTPCPLALSCPNFPLLDCPSLAKTLHLSLKIRQRLLTRVSLELLSRLHAPCSQLGLPVQASVWHIFPHCGHLRTWGLPSPGASPGQTQARIICVLRSWPKACPTDSGWSPEVYWGPSTAEWIVFSRVHKLLSFSYIWALQAASSFSSWCNQLLWTSV